MNRFIKSALLSGTFALSACNAQKQETPMVPLYMAINTPYMVDPDIIDKMARKSCLDLYKAIGNKEPRSCVVSIISTNGKESRKIGNVDIQCSTSPWYFQPKYCRVKNGFKPS